MRKITTTQSAFFYLRASIGLLLLSAGAFLALSGIGQFSAQAQQQNQSNNSKLAPAFAQFVPPMFDCSQMRALGIDTDGFNHAIRPDAARELHQGLHRVHRIEIDRLGPLGAGDIEATRHVIDSEHAPRSQ